MVHPLTRFITDARSAKAVIAILKRQGKLPFSNGEQCKFKLVVPDSVWCLLNKELGAPTSIDDVFIHWD